MYFFFFKLSVQSSRSVVSDSLWPHGLQHARLPCPSPTPKACSNSCPSSRWCHPTISSSVIPFSCLQSFPASGSFPMSQFFASDGQSVGVSASASVLYVFLNFPYFYFDCTGSSCWVHGLSCPKSCGILVPWPEIEPTCPALEGRFLTTGLPGKPQGIFFSGYKLASNCSLILYYYASSSKTGILALKSCLALLENGHSQTANNTVFVW